ncbi:MAG: protein translocase subunit SecF, partial [Actinomycetes bacterium]
MTPRDRADAGPPQGTDADEVQDATDVERDAAASADDDALAGAGLPQEGLSGGGTRPGSLAHRLYNGQSGLDVVGRSRLIYKVTAVVVLLCLASMLFRGFN